MERRVEFPGYRTWDHDIRSARQTRLLAAARAADACTRAKGGQMLITGSLARGQVHPWSDLDLIVIFPNPDARDLRLWEIEEASGLEPHEDVTVLKEQELFADIGARMRVSAVPLDQAPTTLALLPDPELAVERVREAMAIVARNIVEERDKMKRLAERKDSFGDDPNFWKRVHDSTIRRESARAGWRFKVALKRLAAFQDAGRSEWLDKLDDEDALKSMLARLAEPANEPFARPALLTPTILKVAPDLVLRSDAFDLEDYARIKTEAPKWLSAIESWSEFLGGRIAEETIAPTGP